MKCPLILSKLTILLLLLILVSGEVSGQNPSGTGVPTPKNTKLKGLVVDEAGAVVSHARLEIIDPDGNSLGETFSSPDGTFEIISPVKTVTIVAYAQGVGRFRKELNLDGSVVEKLNVKLTMDCSRDIKQLIPKKLDLQHLLVEIHYQGAFGDCPEKVYRLWGTGEASMSYVACGGKTFRKSRLIDTGILTSSLSEIAKASSNPLCHYYAGGIDAPSVEFTIFSGSEPRLVISHDEGAEIQGLSEVVRQLEKLIDPEGLMLSFEAKQARARSKK